MLLISGTCLSLIYTLAGGIDAAQSIVPVSGPWVMISVNGHEDLHFRKAEFDPADCPLDCSRPCENVCPANAISLSKRDPTKKEHINRVLPDGKELAGLLHILETLMLLQNF